MTTTKAPRPMILDDFVGQGKIKDNLKVFIKAAIERGEPLDHSLMSGPPGLGKTTLAGIVAAEMGSEMHPAHGANLQRARDVTGPLADLGDRDLLFIDEVHRAGRPALEILYTAMEDYHYDAKGEGRARVSIRPFTLVGATTEEGMLPAPLRDRFGIRLDLQYYGVDELADIVTRAGERMGTDVVPMGALEIARRCRRTPRVAIRMLRRARDFAQARSSGIVTSQVAKEALGALGIDELGMDGRDRALLRALASSDGPVGLEALSFKVGESAETISHAREPWLLREGLMERGPRGREITRSGRDLVDGWGNVSGGRS